MQIKDLKEYSDLFSNSKDVKSNSVFFCTTDDLVKSEKYINEAIEKGASLVVVSKRNPIADLVVSILRVDDVYKEMSEAAYAFYDKQPANMVAVTGTNGKTSTVEFILQMLEMNGKKAATVGTLGIHVNGKNVELNNTTPGAIEMAKILKGFVEQGVEYAAFEASSHALDQYRIHGVKLKVAGFTNLTQDHLDYHKDMKTYLEAKKKLFSEVLADDGVMVLNADEACFDELVAVGKKVISYGRKAKDIRLIEFDIVGARAKIEVMGKAYDISFPVSGEFQIMNALCALGLMMALGFDCVKCLEKLRAPLGRMELAGEKDGARVYVDYAHTPDALEKAILSLKPYVKNKMRVLFGCGGNRDITKRPIMGKIAEDLADVVYVTDDNPRFEDAVEIRSQVLVGCPNKGIDAGDRESSIKKAMSELKSGDVLLIAGKGHEDYQIIGDVKHHLSDVEMVRNLI